MVGLEDKLVSRIKVTAPNYIRGLILFSIGLPLLGFYLFSILIFNLDNYNLPYTVKTILFLSSGLISVIGIITSIILYKISKSDDKYRNIGRNMAIVGIISSSILLVILIGIVIVASINAPFAA